MDATFNWSSIEKKIGAGAKGSSALSVEAAALPPRFIQIMSESISDSVSRGALTANEAAAVLSVPFECTKITTKSTSTGVLVEMGFSFMGEKTLVSISPGKTVGNLVALFNNGYNDNNVDPARPPRGMWHGKKLVIWPNAKTGAHFVGRAVQRFKNELTAQGCTVQATISGEYSTGTN